MSLSFSPLSPALGAKIHGLDPHHLDETDRKALREAFREYGVLHASGLELSPDDHVALTRVFGEPDIHPIEAIRLAGHPEIIVLAAASSTRSAPTIRAPRTGSAGSHGTPTRPTRRCRAAARCSSHARSRPSAARRAGSISRRSTTRSRTT
jgi:alpha-ketoglutarate-dependent taurine dioxygenase